MRRFPEFLYQLSERSVRWEKLIWFAMLVVVVLVVQSRVMYKGDETLGTLTIDHRLEWSS